MEKEYVDKKTINQFTLVKYVLILIENELIEC